MSRNPFVQYRAPRQIPKDIMREFRYRLIDRWGNEYVGSIFARNGSHAYEEAIRRESGKVRDIEKHIMTSIVRPV